MPKRRTEKNAAAQTRYRTVGRLLMLLLDAALWVLITTRRWRQRRRRRLRQRLSETRTIYLALLLWHAIVKVKPHIRICENQSVELPDKQSKWFFTLQYYQNAPSSTFCSCRQFQFALFLFRFVYFSPEIFNFLYPTITVPVHSSIQRTKVKNEKRK